MKMKRHSNRHPFKGVYKASINLCGIQFRFREGPPFAYSAFHSGIGNPINPMTNVSSRSSCLLDRDHLVVHSCYYYQSTKPRPTKRKTKRMGHLGAPPPMKKPKTPIQPPIQIGYDPSYAHISPTPSEYKVYQPSGQPVMSASNAMREFSAALCSWAMVSSVVKPI